MRTKTFSIESDGKALFYPVPKDWVKIITLTCDGQPLPAVIVPQVKKKDQTMIMLKKALPPGKIIQAQVMLGD